MPEQSTRKERLDVPKIVYSIDDDDEEDRQDSVGSLN